MEGKREFENRVTLLIQCHASNVRLFNELRERNSLLVTNLITPTVGQRTRTLVSTLTRGGDYAVVRSTVTESSVRRLYSFQMFKVKVFHYQ